jgi:hypothetical protein
MRRTSDGRQADAKSHSKQFDLRGAAVARVGAENRPACYLIHGSGRLQDRQQEENGFDGSDGVRDARGGGRF